MSVALLTPSSPSLLPRKRTSSFSYQPFSTSNPRPAKAPRIAAMGALRRTESCHSLELESPSTTTTTAPKSEMPTVPYRRSLQYQQDQRALRRQQAADRASTDNLTAHPVRTAPSSQSRPISRQQTMLSIPPQQAPAASASPSTQPPPRPRSSARSRNTARSTTKSHSSSSPKRIPAPLKAPAQVILPSATSPHAVAIVTTYRTTSPLSPVRAVLPGRPIFPRSKAEPDLYKKALLSRMKQTEEGKRIVCMGPRLAISIWTATRELARIVEDQERRDRDFDIIMGDEDTSQASPAPLTNSWVVVKPNEDWEMVDCAA